MCCKTLLLKVSVLGITFVLGLLAVVFYFELTSNIDISASPCRKSAATATSGPDYGIGFAADSTYTPDSDVATNDSGGLRITSKPRAAYTNTARNNNIQGSVRLKVTFLANGQVGGITVVKGLPDGLTEQAIAAAGRIKFEPKKVNRVVVSVSRLVDYSFSIY